MEPIVEEDDYLGSLFSKGEIDLSLNVAPDPAHPIHPSTKVVMIYSFTKHPNSYYYLDHQGQVHRLTYDTLAHDGKRYHAAALS